MNSNGRISAPISLHADVYPVLGVAKTGTYYDIGYICSNAHGKTNKWSRHKPVRVNTMQALTDAQFDTNTHEGGDRYNMYGLQVDIMHLLLTGYTQNNKITAINTGTDSFLYKLAKGQLAAWNYLAPRPGTDWCRLTDFDGYRHNVPDPMPAPRAGTYQLSAAGAVNIAVDDVHDLVEVGELNLTNLLVPSAINNLRPALSTLYRGLLFYNDSLTDVFFLTEASVGEGHVALMNNDRITMTDHAGIWHVRSFFSSAKIELCDTSYSTADYWLPAHDQPVDIILYEYGKPYVVEITTCKYIDTNKSQVNVVARVTAYAQVLSLTSISIDYYTGLGWYTAQTFSNATLQPGGNYQNFAYTGNALLWQKVRFCVTVNGTAVTVESAIGNP